VYEFTPPSGSGAPFHGILNIVGPTEFPYMRGFNQDVAPIDFGGDTLDPGEWLTIPMYKMDVPVHPSAAGQPLPVMISFDPTHAAIGESVDVRGCYLAGVDGVRVDGQEAVTVVVDGRTMSFTVPAGVSEGVVDVEVYDTGVGSTTRKGAFTVDPT
jgi:hypothetical protein